MNAKKAKHIRRSLREELKSSGERWIAHPTFYTNGLGSKMLKYKFQYILSGGKQLVRLAKRIYKLSGMLPRIEEPKNASKSA